MQHNEATDPSEILIKKEKAESPTAVDSILSKDSTSGPGVGHINLHSRPSENPLFPTCERRDFAALKFSGHVAMLGGTMPPYHAANFHTESYRPPLPRFALQVSSNRREGIGDRISALLFFYKMQQLSKRLYKGRGMPSVAGYTIPFL